MPYELFDKKRTHGGPAAVSITKYGNFVINSSAIELLQKRPYIQVYWNKDEGKVAFKPVKNANEPSSYHVNYSPKGSVGSISGTAFLKHVGYALKETRSFPATWSDREGLLEIQLVAKGAAARR